MAGYYERSVRRAAQWTTGAEGVTGTAKRGLAMLASLATEPFRVKAPDTVEQVRAEHGAKLAAKRKPAAKPKADKYEKARQRRRKVEKRTGTSSIIDPLRGVRRKTGG
jgi:hypothetical protein